MNCNKIFTEKKINRFKLQNCSVLDYNYIKFINYPNAA